MSVTQIFYNTVSPIIFPIFYRKIKFEGMENLPTSGGYILASAHVDWLDGFYISAVVKKQRGVATHFLTASNNYWWSGVTMKIPAERGEVVGAVAQQLRQGKVLCNFPEGQRNATGKLGAGKTGTVRIAIESGVPVIPVGLTCDPGRNMGQSLRYLLSAEHQVQLRFGQPLPFTMPPQGMTNEWLQAETEHLMRAIAALATKKYNPE